MRIGWLTPSDVNTNRPRESTHVTPSPCGSPSDDVAHARGDRVVDAPGHRVRREDVHLRIGAHGEVSPVGRQRCVGDQPKRRRAGNDRQAVDQLALERARVATTHSRGKHEHERGPKDRALRRRAAAW